ncbi:MAG: hypothetical protein KatS3mg035_0043 [Bacteroidia bacterium]|nr:MAG: hypothetical protein KatS3mg035_0043 [Bacteroidia bacterium]
MFLRDLRRNKDVYAIMNVGYTTIPIENVLSYSEKVTNPDGKTISRYKKGYEAYHDLILRAPDLLEINAKDGVKILSMGYGAPKFTEQSFGEFEATIDYNYVIRVSKNGENYKIAIGARFNSLGGYNPIIHVFKERLDTEGNIVSSITGDDTTYQEFLDIQIPIFAIEDLVKNENGENYLYEIVNHLDVIRYLSKYKDKLKGGKR